MNRVYFTTCALVSIEKRQKLDTVKSCDIINWDQENVKSVPMNYAFRFSGSVAWFTARRVWYGVGAPICQPDRPSARYKDVFVPRRFSNSSLRPSLPSFPLLHGLYPASGLCELHRPPRAP